MILVKLLVLGLKVACWAAHATEAASRPVQGLAFRRPQPPCPPDVQYTYPQACRSIGCIAPHRHRPAGSASRPRQAASAGKDHTQNRWSSLSRRDIQQTVCTALRKVVACTSIWHQQWSARGPSRRGAPDPTLAKPVMRPSCRTS